MDPTFGSTAPRGTTSELVSHFRPGNSTSETRDALEAIQEALGPMEITPTTRYDLDVRSSNPMTTQGLHYAIRGRARVIENKVGISLASFNDPIKALLNVVVAHEHRVIIKKKFVVHGRAIVAPERAPARTVAVQEKVRELHLQRYGGDVEMNLNLALEPEMFREELEMKINAQQQELERALIELGYEAIMEGSTLLTDAILRSSSMYNSMRSELAMQHAERIYISDIFGCLAKNAYPITGLVSAARHASAYSPSQVKTSVMMLPFGSPELLEHLRPEKMVYSIGGLSTKDKKPVTMELNNTYVDPATDLRIVIHTPLPTFEYGADAPTVTDGCLSQRVTIFMHYPYHDPATAPNAGGPPPLVGVKLGFRANGIAVDKDSHTRATDFSHRTMATLPSIEEMGIPAAANTAVWSLKCHRYNETEEAEELLGNLLSDMSAPARAVFDLTVQVYDAVFDYMDDRDLSKKNKSYECPPTWVGGGGGAGVLTPDDLKESLDAPLAANLDLQYNLSEASTGKFMTVFCLKTNGAKDELTEVGTNQIGDDGKEDSGLTAAAAFTPALEATVRLAVALHYISHGSDGSWTDEQRSLFVQRKSLAAAKVNATAVATVHGYCDDFSGKSSVVNAQKFYYKYRGIIDDGTNYNTKGTGAADTASGEDEMPYIERADFAGDKLVIVRRMDLIMSSAIIATPGCGELYAGYPQTGVSTSQTDESVKIQLRAYLGAALVAPENCIRIPNVHFEGVICGGEVPQKEKFIDMSTPNAHAGDEHDFWHCPAGDYEKSCFAICRVGKVDQTDRQCYPLKDTPSRSVLEYHHSDYTDVGHPTIVYQGHSIAADGRDITSNNGHLGVMDHPANANRIFGSFSAGPVSSLPSVSMGHK